MSLDSTLLAAAKEYSSRRAWVTSSQAAVEFLTIIDETLSVLFTNHTQPGVDSAVGLSCLSFLPPDQQGAFRAAIDNAVATGLPWHYETQATGPNGEMSYYSGWVTLLSSTGDSFRAALIGTDISHVRRVEEKLALSDETFRALVTGASDYITVIDEDHVITFLNRRNHHGSVDDVIGNRLEDYLPCEDHERIGEAVARVFAHGGFESYESRVRTGIALDSPMIRLNTRLSPIFHNDKVVSVAMVSTDVTQSRRDQEALRDSEERLRQSQQLQSIGQLTGGIAHDFNNLLMVMQGSLQLASQAIDDRPMALGLIEDAMRAADRAAELTQRLLAFGRRQSLQPKAIEVSELFSSMASMMKRTLGTQVEIQTATAHDIWDCFADEVQLESALLNLAINARDALGRTGGTIRLLASNLLVGETSLGTPELAAGDYVRIDVCDDGPGCDKETLGKLFEPFFTTKAVGRGSGLGLSMVYGFAQQSSGHVAVSSELGAGLEVSLYLPRGVATKESTEPIDDVAGIESHGASILMVEDIDDVARITMKMLERLGYRVTRVGSGEEALVMLSVLTDVQLVLTDVGLPGTLHGVALAHEIRKQFPELPVLFMTGYDNGLLDGEKEAHVLKKPFAIRALGEALEKRIGPKSASKA